jgi:hypothetical protein
MPGQVSGQQIISGAVPLHSTNSLITNLALKAVVTTTTHAGTAKASGDDDDTRRI